MTLILEFNNFTSLITITTLAAHAVISERLINMCWFRELLTNNCIQPRVAIEIEGRTKTFASMGTLNVSFVKSAGLLRRIFLLGGHRAGLYLGPLGIKVHT